MEHEHPRRPAALGVRHRMERVSKRSAMMSASHVEITIFRSGMRYVASTRAASPW
jgi:hypothetical protein